MDRVFAKRLKKLIPENGGFDLSFNLSNSGQPGKVASTLNLTVFGPAGEGKGQVVLKKISIPAIAGTIEEANRVALEDTLRLLGV